MKRYDPTAERQACKVGSSQDRLLRTARHVRNTGGGRTLHNLGTRYPGRAKKMAKMLHLAVVTDVVEVVGREVVHRD